MMEANLLDAPSVNFEELPDIDELMQLLETSSAAEQQQQTPPLCVAVCEFRPYVRKDAKQRSRCLADYCMKRGITHINYCELARALMPEHEYISVRCNGVPDAKLRATLAKHIAGAEERGMRTVVVFTGHGNNGSVLYDYQNDRASGEHWPVFVEWPRLVSIGKVKRCFFVHAHAHAHL